MDPTDHSQCIQGAVSERLRAITCKTIPPEPGVVKTCHEAADLIEDLEGKLLLTKLRLDRCKEIMAAHEISEDSND